MAENENDTYGSNTTSYNDGANATRTAGPKLLDPISFAVFVVTNVGGVYRQLANVRYEPSAEDNDKYLRGADAVRLCLRVVLALSHPSNRIPIEGELALAADAYTRGGMSLTATGLDNNMIGSRVYESHTQPWPPAPWLREFPFISLALHLAASYDPALHAYDSCMHEEPLGLVYDDDNVKYAIGIIDITDIDAVRYGIVAAGHRMVHIPQVMYRMEVTYDCAAEFRTRVPLSAQDYMEKFQYKSQHDFDKDAIILLQELPLISTEALQAVWPDPHLATVGHREAQIPGPSTKFMPLRNLADLAASNLINSLFEPVDNPREKGGSNYDHDETQGPIPVPTSTIPHNAAILQNVPFTSGAQAALRRELLKRASELHQSPHAAYLLGVAFSGQAHLPWAAFDQLSVAVLHTALQHPGIQDAKSISLCIDTIQGTPEAIVKALCASGISFRYLCFHQSPQRTDDSCTTQLYEHLSKSLLLGAGVRLTLTGACSSALRYRMWCPDVTNHPASANHFLAFPMQHLFIRGEMNPSGIGNKAFVPFYMHLTDTLLPPEEFAAAFLVFLSGLLLDSIALEEQVPLLFAHCLTGLADLTFQSTQAIRHGFRVAHPAAENLAVPILPFTKYRFSNRRYVGEALSIVRRKQTLSDLECWPLVRDMTGGAWTVVVSRERRKISKYWVTEADHDVFGDDTVVRYAFVKAGDHGQIVSVGDLTTFLAATAPELDREIVIQQIAKTEDHIRESLGRSLGTSQGQSTSYINVFGESDALGLLSVFLEDAKSYGRDALQALMREDRDLTQSWYPDFAANIPQADFDTAQEEVVLPRRSSNSFVNVAGIEDED